MFDSASSWALNDLRSEIRRVRREVSKNDRPDAICFNRDSPDNVRAIIVDAYAL
jgi:hypothetical protein